MPSVFVLYWLAPSKHRWMLLLVASYYFYMSWSVKYVVLILFTTVVSYFCALLISRTNNSKKKKTLLLSTLIMCLGLLFFFKYFNFFSNSIVELLNAVAIPVHAATLSLMLPVGISFYTFQTLSYVIDVYKGDIAAEPHFGKYATFISFFPQLVAGPIERTSNLLPQINKEHQFDYTKATYGLKLMAWGYFKKIVVADTLAIYVDRIYGSVTDYQGLSLLLATVFFTFQIYCDFSGYSDIAVGTAKLFNIDLMTNFKSPYFSASIKEFWSRWHISLSTWFRDYVYIPLGGNHVSKSRHKLNLLITFLVSGLWHGASWTYVIWGGVHGVAQIVESIIISNENRKLHSKRFSFRWLISVCIVFVFCCCAWVFFRSDTITEAIYVFKNMFVGVTSPYTYIKNGYNDLGIGITNVVLISFSLLILLVYDYISMHNDVIYTISQKSLLLRWSIYLIFILYVISVLPLEDTTSFIYFQF